MKILTLDKLSFDPNDTRLDRLDTSVGGSSLGRVNRAVSKSILSDLGSRVNAVYITAYARAAVNQSNNSLLEFNTFGVLCIPYEFFPEGSLINSEKKDLFFIFDTCEGYKNHTYPYEKAEVHVNYLIRHLPDLTKAFSSMYQRSHEMEDIKRNTLFILLSPEEISSLGVVRNSIPLSNRDNINIEKALKKLPNDIDTNSILNVVKTAEPLANKLLSEISTHKNEVKSNINGSMDIRALNGEQLTNLIVNSVKDKNVIHPTVRNIVERRNKEFDNMLQRLNIVPTRNFLKVYREVDHLIKTSIKIKGVNNESSLIIYGPPGVGKTFAVDAYRHLNSSDYAFAFISGDPENIAAYRNDLIGRNIVTAKNGGTQNEYVPGQLVIALSDAIVNKKKALNVIINEFNRSASLDKLDQIIRDVGDTGIIRIEAQADMEELVSVMREKYGINAKFRGGFIEIDTNDVDGKGTRIPVTFTLIGNLPDKDLSASSLGVHEEIPAALVRRSQTRRLDYLNPYTQQGLLELKMILLCDRHFNLLLGDYVGNIAIINGVAPDLLFEDTKKAIESNDFESLKNKYGETVYTAVNEFVGHSDNSIVEQTIAFYNTLYDMYQNEKIKIVPSIPEIMNHFETILNVLSNAASLQDVQDDITDFLKQFIDKYVSFKMIDVEDVDETFKDFAKMWTNHILKPALLYDYFNLIPSELFRNGKNNGKER